MTFRGTLTYAEGASIDPLALCKIASWSTSSLDPAGMPDLSSGFLMLAEEMVFCPETVGVPVDYEVTLFVSGESGDPDVAVFGKIETVDGIMESSCDENPIEIVPDTIVEGVDFILEG